MGESSILRSMETEMGKVKVIAHDMVTPLGKGSRENFLRISAGETALRCYDGKTWGLAEDFVAGIIETPIPSPRARHLASESIKRTFEHLSHPLPKESTLLVLSTTKGNIELLENDSQAKVELSEMAESLQKEIELEFTPIVVSNACTSGVCAIISAMRALKNGHCQYVIVCGVEAQSRFIISGFQSFHALSTEPCQPFSANRMGLNVGEAAATMILTTAEHTGDEDWTIEAGAIRNDAFHISGPSRVGEGSFRALQAVTRQIAPDTLAFISVHGTATPFNDEMESIAIERAGLQDVPIFSLKGYYGHTMGAAGVLETILSMEAIDQGVILGTKGYDNELGVGHPICISAGNRTTTRREFVKLISGFGGCNAAIRMKKGGDT